MLDFNDPKVGIPLVDEIAGIAICQGAHFTCEQLCRLGVVFGTVYSLAKGDSADPAKPPNNLQALFEWAKIDLIHPLREIRYRLAATDDVTSAPPVLRFRDFGSKAEMADEVTAFTTWIAEDFIGADALHREWFLFGLQHFALFEPVFSDSDNQAGLSTLREAAVQFSRAWLHSVVVELIEGRVRPEEALAIRRGVQEQYGLSVQDTATPEGVQQALDQVSAELHVEGILRVLAGLVDLIVPELSHDLKPLSRDTVVDWDWLRDQIVKLKKQKMRFPAIGLNVDGSIVTTELDEFAASHLAIPDLEKEVYVINNLGGVSFITIEFWKDLAAGKLWREP